MKEALINYIQHGPNDELYTPAYAIRPLLPYLDKTKTYFEPCTPPSGHNNIADFLLDEGYLCEAASKDLNFLTAEGTIDQDIIITNPPYSLKTEFLRRCFEFGKPFAMLLPITALEGVERSYLFRKYGIQVLVLDRRINFMEEGKSNWFNTSWFCKDILPRDLMFAEVI